MPPISKRARHLKKAREIQAQKLEMKKNDKRRKINKIINEMDESKLDHALELVTNLDTSTKEQHESSDIVMLSEEGRVSSSELN